MSPCFRAYRYYVLKNNAGKRSYLKVFALQFAAAALVFCALLIFRSISGPAVRKSYETVIKAFLYDIPVSENDDDIGKIKFVDKEKNDETQA